MIFITQHKTPTVRSWEVHILFPIEFMTTARFHLCVGGGLIFIPNGRINFESGLGKKGKSPAFGCVVMKLQDNWQVNMITK